MVRQLAIGPLTNAGLFAHGLAANSVLAGLANAAFQNRHWFAADHAFFTGFGHRLSVPQIIKLPTDQLTIFICFGFSTTISKPYCG